MEFNWTVFWVTVSFLAIFVLSYLAHKAGPPPGDS